MDSIIEQAVERVYCSPCKARTGDCPFKNYQDPRCEEFALVLAAAKAAVESCSAENVKLRRKIVVLNSVCDAANALVTIAVSACDHSKEVHDLLDALVDAGYRQE